MSEKDGVRSGRHPEAKWTGVGEEPADAIGEAGRIFGRQKAAYSPSDSPSLETRLDRIGRVETLCRNHIGELTEALRDDFGARSPDWTFTADIFSPLSHAMLARKRLKGWMKPERAPSGWLALTGQRTYIVNEPLGVVGIMSPFNAPVSLALDPAIDALAAGNRAMVKISESAPRTASLLKALAAEYFEAEELAVVAGGLEVSRFFAALPWDKFFFTGGSEVGSKILAAAAENLTPVILELGGKSPCVVLEDADIAAAAEKIGRVRLLNAGQVCIAGDYALVPERHLETFVEAAVRAAETAYPSIVDNPDFTSIINGDAYGRIVSYIDEARAAGCRIVQANPMNEAVPNRETRKIPLTVVVDPAPHLMVSRREIFGPVLSVWPYRGLEEAIAHINRGEKPLALYIFGKSRGKIRRVIAATSSGGVTVNDLMMHAHSGAMGFGGVGYSGTGRYKGGIVGYRAFTNPKAVFEQGLMRRFTGVFFPPYRSGRARRMLRRRVGVR